MKTKFALAFAFFLALGLAGSATAETYAITGGTVYTLGAAGKIENGTVLIADGKIVAVGADVSIPDDAVRIDAHGKVVTPGIFDPESEFGVVEVSQVRTTRDAAQDTRFSAAFNVAAAINPRSVLIPVNRIAGVTRAMVAPGGGADNHVIIGQGVLIDLGGTEDFIHRNPAAMFALLGEAGSRHAGGSRAIALLKLREAFEDARDYAAHRGAYETNRRRDYALSRLDLEALIPVLQGKLPLIVEVNRASDIEAALRLARDFHLDLIVAGGAEAWMVADELAAARVPVLLNPLEDLPSRFESLGASLHNAARLEKAGVLIAFATGDTHNARNVTQAAGNAVAYGLPWLAAIKAMMLNPTIIYGVNDQLGTLEAGKIADVVVWEGDPLELDTYAEQVFIAGKPVPMVSRQTLLRDRYMQENFGKSPLPAEYIKPDASH